MINYGEFLNRQSSQLKFKGSLGKKKKTFKGALTKKIKGNDTIFFLLKVSVLLSIINHNLNSQLKFKGSLGKKKTFKGALKKIKGNDTIFFSFKSVCD